MLGYFIEAGQYFLCLMPILIVLIAGMYVIHKKKGYDTPVVHIVLLILFLACINGVLYITGAATVGDIVHWREGILKAEKINLIPMRWGIGDPFGFIMNIFLFVPMGFLLPLLWKRFTRIKNTVLAGFLFSFVIEASQLINNRATDIDDLLTNTIGTVVGYLCFMIIGKKMAERFPMRVHGRCYSKWIYLEGGFWIAIMFLLHFFMIPFIRQALWGVFI